METEKRSYFSTFSDGIFKQNPISKLALGLCAALAITTTVAGGLAMGVCTAIVLVLSSLAASLLRDVIPKKVQFLAHLIIIATFATLVQLLLQVFFPSIAASLGIFVPLIAVNSILLLKTEEAFEDNNVLASVLDGLGTGIGYIFVLFLVSVVRELFGSGRLFGFSIYPASLPPLRILSQPAGGFFVLAVVIALFVFVEQIMKKKDKPNTVEKAEEKEAK